MLISFQYVEPSPNLPIIPQTKNPALIMEIEDFTLYECDAHHECFLYIIRFI